MRREESTKTPKFQKINEDLNHGNPLEYHKAFYFFLRVS